MTAGHNGGGSTPLILRFWAKVLPPLTSEGVPTDDPDQCWLWGGYIGKNNSSGPGYGQIRDQATGTRARLVKAHRVSYQLAHGEIPDRWDVCHACDNTICVNPSHLFVAPHKSNMADYIQKYGAICRPKSPLTVDQLHLYRDEGCGEESLVTRARESAVAAGDYDMGADEVAV